MCLMGRQSTLFYLARQVPEQTCVTMFSHVSSLNKHGTCTVPTHYMQPQQVACIQTLKIQNIKLCVNFGKIMCKLVSTQVTK